MARKTSGYIKRKNVTSEQIIEILNSDKGKLPNKNVTSNQMFDKGSVLADLYGKFINGDGNPNQAPATRSGVTDWNNIDSQVPGETDSERLDYTKAVPLRVGDLRGYGGSEGDIIIGDNELPEIYWANIFTTDNIDHIPDSSIIKMMKEDNIELSIPVHPKIEICASHASKEKQERYHLLSTEHSVLFREGAEDVVNNSNLATNVGIDYPNGERGVPKFKVKITPYLDNQVLDLEQGSTFRALFDIYPTYKSIVDKAMMSGLITADSYLYTSYIKTTKYYYIASPSNASWSSLNVKLSEAHRITHNIDGYITHVDNTPISQWHLTDGTTNPFINRVEPGSDWINIGASADASLSYGQANFLAIASKVLTIIGIIITVILILDRIWDKFHPEVLIPDGTYQYANFVKGMYKFNDIIESYHILSYGNKWEGLKIEGDNGEKDNVVINGWLSKLFTLNDPNYHTLFSSSNLIPIFPHSSNLSKFLNFRFYPKCIQYDYNTPPPLFDFLVELVPIENCKLSETKITKFSVKIAPDKYMFPRFDVKSAYNETHNIGSRLRPKYVTAPTVSNNTMVRFVNAKYVDFVFLHSSKTSYLFGQWFDICLNRDGIVGTRKGLFGSRSGTYYKELTGRDLTIIPNQLYNNTGDSQEELELFKGNEGLYEVAFMQDEQPNLIFNPTFRTEDTDERNGIFRNINKFWIYGTNQGDFTQTDRLYIKNGAFYKTNSILGGGYLYQILDDLKDASLYTLKISLKINNGDIFIKTENTFHNRLYTKYIPSNHIGHSGGDIHVSSQIALSNYNIDVANNKLRFTESGEYYIVLNTIYNNNKTLYFELSQEFEGYISECELQYLPFEGIGRPTDRGVNIAGFDVKLWSNNKLRNGYNAIALANQEELLLYYKDSNADTSYISLYYYNNGIVNTTGIYNYIFEIGVSSYIRVKIDFIGYNGVILHKRFDPNVDNASIEINETFNEPLLQILIDLKTINIQYPPVVGSLICNDPQLTYVIDSFGSFENAFILLDNSGLKALTFEPIIVDRLIQNHNTPEDERRNRFPNVNWTSIPFTGASIKFLFIANTPCNDSIENLPIVTDVLDISNTNIYSTNVIGIADLLYDKSNGNGNIDNGLIANNTKVSNYGFGSPNYKINDRPSIEWTNSNIGLSDLIQFLIYMDETATTHGYLDISGDNPAIYNSIALSSIIHMFTKQWHIKFNGNEIITDDSLSILCDSNGFTIGEELEDISLDSNNF